MEASSKEQSKLHIAMFPWFSYGHINPYIQLSNKLSSHGIQISFFSIPGNIDRIKSSLDISPPNQIIPLTIPPIQGLSPNFDSSSDYIPQIAGLLIQAITLMQPQMKALLSQLQPHIVIIDFHYNDLPSIASELGIKSICFSAIPAAYNAYVTVPSRMPDPNKPPTLEDLKNPPQGYPQSSTSLVKTFETQNSQWLFNGKPTLFEKIMNFIKSCDAIIYRTCTEVDGPYLDYFQKQVNKPVLLAGPSSPLPPSGELEEKWRIWLDKFQEESVIYCSFGSETSLSDSQIKELTLGLELTYLPFFLVLKFGSSGGVDAQNKLEASLPEGFRERTKDRGVVHTGWVQQQHILQHKSVGCFLTHAGSSAVVEGIVSNCQLIFLPLSSGQCMNSKVFSGDLKVGVEINRRDKDGYFGKEDVLEAIKTVMMDHTDKEPGRSIRKNRENWRNFFLSKDIEARYVARLVDKLVALAQNY